MTKEEFLSKVKQILNEVSNDYQGVEIVGLDTMNIASHVESLFVDAWLTVYNELIPNTTQNLFNRNIFNIIDFSKEVELHHDIDKGSGFFYIPNDLFDVYYFKLKGWHNPAGSYITTDNPLYERQSNPYARGNFIRPILVMDITPVKDCKRRIEYYSLKKGVPAVLEKFLYVPMPKSIDDITIQSNELTIVLAYTIASMIYSLQGLEQIAVFIYDKAKSFAKM